MLSSATVIVSYDDPECGGAADALISKLRPSSAAEAPIIVKPVPVTDADAGSTHCDGIVSVLQSLVSVPSSSIFIISCLKDGAPEEHRRIRELVGGAQNSSSSPMPPPGNCQILTHLSNYNDVALTLQNMVRWVAARRAACA